MSEIWRSPVDEAPPKATVSGRYDLINHTITVVFQMPAEQGIDHYIPAEISSEVARGFGQWLIKCANRKDDHGRH